MLGYLFKNIKNKESLFLSIVFIKTYLSYFNLLFLKKCMLIKKSKDSLVNLTVRDIKNYENDLEEVPLIMEIGDVALFTNYTIHRSNHNLSKYVRFSGVSRINSITKVADDKLIDKKSARKSSD